MKTSHPLLELWKLVSAAPRGPLLFLISAMIFIGLTEGLGIVMLVPLLETLSSDTQGPATQILTRIFNVSAPPLGIILSVVVGLTIIRAVLQYIQSVMSAKIQHQLVDDMRQNCFSGLIHSEWRWFADKKSSDYTSMLVGNVNRIGTGLHHALSLASGSFSLIALFFAALALSWKMALVTFAGGVIVLLAFGAQKRRALNLGRDFTQAAHSFQGHIQEGLAGIRIAKILSKEALHLSKLSVIMKRLRSKQVDFIASAAINRAVLQILGAAMISLFVYLGVVWWKQSYVVLLPLVLIFARMVPTLGALQQSYQHWLHAVPALRESRQLLKDTALFAEPALEKGWTPIALEKELALSGVSFTYSSRTAPATNDMTLTFPARTTSAIIGQSGAGKSTLADLIMGLIEPDQGRVTVGGTVITGQDRQRWRRSVAYVQQAAFLYNDTVRANLQLSAPNASEDDMRRVLNAASAEFVLNLPEGLDTPIGDGGVLLSGGERQRVVLARALLGTPSLLILDEATSALDPENEAKIREAIAKLHGDMTIILIGHRLSMLDQADQIIELKDGIVFKSGPAKAKKSGV